MRDSIQDQIEHIKDDLFAFLYADYIAGSVENFGITKHGVSGFINEIILTVMKECCEKAGEPLSLQQRLAIRNRIESHFPWLEEK